MADIECQKQQSIEKEVTKKGKTKKNQKQKCQDCGKAFLRIYNFRSARQKNFNCKIYD